MGVSHFWSLGLSPVKDITKNPYKSLDTLQNKTVGVDLSVWIHQIISTSPVYLKLCFDKPRKVEEVLNFISKHVNILQKYGITIIPVLDGKEHGMKKIALQKRNKTRQTCKSGIESFFQKCFHNPEQITDKDRSDFERYMKGVVGRSDELTAMILNWFRKENINFICAPFEAEWQLVYLEKEKTIDAIITSDSDAIILGAKRVIFDINFERGEYREYNEDLAIQTHAHDKSRYKIFKYGKANFPIIASLLGNDYTKGFDGVGNVTIFKICERLLQKFGASNQWTMQQLRFELEDIGQGTRRFHYNDDVWNEFEQCTNLFYFCPIVDTYDGEIIPLKEELRCAAWDSSTWEKLIGFAPLQLLPKDTISESVHPALSRTSTYEHHPTAVVLLVHTPT